MALPHDQWMGLPNSPSFRYKALNPAYQSDPRRILGQSLMTQGVHRQHQLETPFTRGLVD